MRKDEKLKFLIVIIIAFIFSIGVSFIINNFNVLHIEKNERIVKNIDISALNVANLNLENGKLVSTNLDNKKIYLNYSGYVNKLIIDYNTSNNFYININYFGRDYYNNEVLKTAKEGFNSRLNTSIVKINDDLRNIVIDLSQGDGFTISSIKVDNSISFNFYLFLLAFFAICLFVIIYFYYKYHLFNNKVEYLFLSIILIVGSLIILFDPNTTSISWDDQIHYSNMFRIFNFSGVTNWTQADYDMTYVSPFISIDTIGEKQLQDTYLNSSDKIVKVESNSPFIQYSQVGYLVPGFVMKLCSLLRIPFTFKIILTKLSMLIVYSLVIFWAIKIIPRGKMILIIVGLFPTNIFLATQFSYDPPITAFLILFTAVFIRLLEDNNEKLDIKNCFLLIFSVLIASFIKAVYIPFILLLLFIPSEKYFNNRQKNHFKIGVLLIFVLMVSTFVFPTITETASLGDLRMENTSPYSQLKVILNNPVGYLKVLNDTAGLEFFGKLIGRSTIISYGYKVDIASEIKRNYEVASYYIILILLIFSIITDSNVEKKDRNYSIINVINVILVFGIILLIWTALYLSFTPVGELTINGVQNRYFIPLIVPLIIISLPNRKIKNNFDRNIYESVIISIYTVVLLYITYTMSFLVFVIN